LIIEIIFKSAVKKFAGTSCSQYLPCFVDLWTFEDFIEIIFKSAVKKFAGTSCRQYLPCFVDLWTLEDFIEIIFRKAVAVGTSCGFFDLWTILLKRGVCKFLILAQLWTTETCTRWVKA